MDDVDPHALPDPTLTLTLPSIHDGTPLDCRIYLPPSILAVATGSAANATDAHLPRWRGHAAIVAHPYAPMGGSYNDPIVKMVAQTLLQPQPPSSSFVVATFNFRGGGRKPQGRTSWTAKPETADYMTIAGFLYYFAHFLDPYGDKEAVRGVPPTSAPAPPPTLLFAGYSYGAMVTSLLPPLATILASFARPLRGSPAAEVRLRAARWAAIQNADFSAAASAAASSSAAKGSPTKARRGEARLSMGVRVGGGPDEDGHWRRRSHEVGGGSSSSGAGGSVRHILSSPTSPRRSLSGGHRGLGHGHGRSSSGNGHANSHVQSHSGSEPHAATDDEGGGGSQRSVSGWMARVRHSTHKDEAAPEDDKSAILSAVPGLPAVQPAYLLVSPPVGLATSLATMSFGAAVSASSGGFFKRKQRVATPTTRQSSTGEDDTSADVAHGDGKTDVAAATDRAIQSNETSDKLACNPTLVVYGDADGFASLKKMRQWAAELAAASASASSTKQPLFQAREVPTAGHFWAEGRTYYELQEAVGAFAADLTGHEA